MVNALSKIIHGTNFEESTQNWRLNITIKEVACIRKDIPVIVPSHVYKTTNKLVDRLANEGVNWHVKDLSTTWKACARNTILTNWQNFKRRTCKL